MELCEIIKKLKNKVYMEEATRLEHEEIKERRRRIQPPSFKGGNAPKAKNCLKEYNVKTHYLRFTEKEKIEDVGTQLEGDALKCYTCFSLEKEKS
ncbi:hypothetical protein A0J61_00080 [Choanephora cucurbitarum]|uniref:Uncharacterized protein n=1 Tax=Choanephora cucurbitarum TaxID=101091 RepID=A0A1C7NS84_9FUNG|nr:hypothetical protein A0J61_00080 [Choanephora cucurbitarum]